MRFRKVYSCHSLNADANPRRQALKSRTLIFSTSEVRGLGTRSFLERRMPKVTRLANGQVGVCIGQLTPPDSELFITTNYTARRSRIMKVVIFEKNGFNWRPEDAQLHGLLNPLNPRAITGPSCLLGMRSWGGGTREANSAQSW